MQYNLIILSFLFPSLNLQDSRFELLEFLKDFYFDGLINVYFFAQQFNFKFGF